MFFSTSISPYLYLFSKVEALGLLSGCRPAKSSLTNITLYSTCEHHLLPIVGKAHVAYISNGTVVGLSKMNRLVDYFAKRPQVQERLTLQVVKSLQEVLNTDDVACVIDAKHLCVNARGIRDIDSSTVTAEFGGAFKNPDVKKEFLGYLNLDTSL